MSNQKNSNKSSDVEIETAKRLGIPHEQVRLVMIDFYHHLLKVLQHPQDYFYKGILIESCFKIRVNPAAVMRAFFWKSNRDCTYTRQMDKDFLTFYNLLHKHDQFSQRQKEAINNYERRDKHTTKE